MPNKEIFEFAKQVYKICKKIPKGFVATYKDIAVALKNPNSSRAGGTALANNPKITNHS